LAIEGDINPKNRNTLTHTTTGRGKRESHPSLGGRPNGNTKNEIADEAKAALEDDLLATEKYPPQNLIN
jgi:hypothetical protein